MASGARSNGFVLFLNPIARKELINLVGICLIVLIISTRYSNAESQVLFFFVKIDANDGAGTQDPSGNGRFRSILAMRMRSKQLPIDPSTICRLILNHDTAILVDVYSKVDVADTLARIINKYDIAASEVPSKCISSFCVLQLSREAKYDGMAACVDIRFETAGIVLLGIIRLDAVSFLLANDVRRVFLSQSL